MPNYEAIINGRTRKIELVKTSPNSFSAKVDGKKLEIKIPEDGLVLEKTLTMDVDGKTYMVELLKARQEKKNLVKVEDAEFEVDVKVADRNHSTGDFEQRPQAMAKKVVPNKKVAVEGAVLAPMTGKIVQVKAKKGDVVRAGQVLCVIEAMKMENEITAPKAGTVQKVNVDSGAPVSEGEALFIIA